MAGLAFRLLRAVILNLSDSSLARLMRIVRGMVYLFSGEAMLRLALSDIVEIFQAGPPGTDTVRKIMRETDPELARHLVQGLLGS